MVCREYLSLKLLSSIKHIPLQEPSYFTGYIFTGLWRVITYRYKSQALTHMFQCLGDGLLPRQYHGKVLQLPIGLGTYIMPADQELFLGQPGAAGGCGVFEDNAIVLVPDYPHVMAVIKVLSPLFKSHIPFTPCLQQHDN